NAVLCNPPFHQQHALTDNVAWEMFHHARRCLKINGELYIVANRHLDYFHKLKKIFGNCTTIATNNKFVVLKAVKLGRRRSEEHTSELQSRFDLVCRLLLEKKNKSTNQNQ